MTRELALALLAEAALAAAIVGLVVRGRWRANVCFTGYIAAALLGNVLVTWWPETFHVWWFWRTKQAAYDLLKLGTAIEIAARTFRGFPGARRTASLAILAVLSITVVLMLAGMGPSNLEVIRGTHARLQHGTVWVMVATFVIVLWSRVPVDPFRRTILVTLGAYMGLMAAALRFQGLHGWSVQPYVNAIDPALYVAMAGWWAARALAREGDEDVRHRNLLRRLEVGHAWSR